jgi:hypothetical protein
MAEADAEAFSEVTGTNSISDTSSVFAESVSVFFSHFK